jgi:hypothetical protein
MSRVEQILDRISRGEVTVEDAVPEFLAVLVRSRLKPEPGSLEHLGAEWETDDTDTWVEVEVAYLLGRLTAHQYDVLRDAFTNKEK